MKKVSTSLHTPQQVSYVLSLARTVLMNIVTGRNFHWKEEVILKELAAKYEISPVQVIFAWHMARRISISTQSKNAERKKEALNVGLFDLHRIYMRLKTQWQLPKLEEADVAKISALDKRQFAYNKPDQDGKIFGWTLEQLGWEHLNPAVKGLFD